MSITQPDYRDMNEHGTSELLCKVCSSLHRKTESFQEVDFGTVAEVLAKSTCQSHWWFPFKDAVSETPNTLDFAKVKRWITKCDSDHIQCNAVHSVRSMRPPAQTYFIDTLDNCLVYKDTSVRYLALSYVWGSATMFKTTSANCNALQRPGALLCVEASLSPVVRDAIEVSRRIEERYLWIDALSIPQDNEIQKAKLITQMDSIYAQAFLTIVALSAESAESPLPGVKQGTRLTNIASTQESITSPDGRLPDIFLTVRPSLHTVLGQCLYSSRGWTFQESCLSRRCLIFTDHETFFHCDSGLESVSGIATRSDAWRGRNILLSVFDKQENSLDVSQQFNLYTRLVFDFSKRKLTYSEDSLKAISGIFAIFSSRFGWRFVAGMPSHLMDHALLWRSASPDRLRNPNFPSWSWVGWSSPSHWHFQNFMDPLWIESEIENATMIPLQSEIQILHNTDAISSLDTHNNIQISVLHVSVDSVQMCTFQLKPGKSTLGQSNYIPLNPYEEIWTMDGLRCGILYDFRGDKRGGPQIYCAITV